MLDNNKETTQESLNQKLILAVKKNNLTEAKTLIDSGANVKTHCFLDKKTPLLNYAVKKSIGKRSDSLNLNMLKLLLEKGAEINGQGERGLTALHRAVYLVSLETVEFLLDNGADPNLSTKDGEKPQDTIQWFLDNPVFQTNVFTRKNFRKEDGFDLTAAFEKIKNLLTDHKIVQEKLKQLEKQTNETVAKNIAGKLKSSLSRTLFFQAFQDYPLVQDFLTEQQETMTVASRPGV